MTTSQKRLFAYLDRLEPSLRRDVERAIARLRERVTVAAILDIVTRADFFALNALTAGLPKDLQRATDVLAKAVQAGSRQAGVMVRGTLALTNREAVRVAGEQTAKLVTNVSRETRTAIRVAVRAGFTDGLSPREVAQLIKPVIGLTERQAKAVLKQRNAGMSPAKLDRYTAKLLKQRAEMIARTEIIAASTEGQIALWKKAQQGGLLAGDVRKQWMVTPDDRLCPRCAALDGVSVPLAQSFTEGIATMSGPPLHPRCRCTLVIAREHKARRAA